MDLERDLRNALKRKSAPAGFADRVMQRVEDSRPRLSSRWRAIAAAAVLLAMLGGWAAHTVAERREGERARHELLLALRITSAKLQAAQSHVVK